MKAVLIVAAVAAVALTGCQKLGGDGAMGGHARGRYVGVGLYPADRMWSQVAGAEASKDPAAAKLDDDQQIIVVLDSQTGELRQCGNFSGHCVGMNPWSQPAGLTPARLARHAAQLLQADEAPAKLPAPPPAPRP